MYIQTSISPPLQDQRCCLVLFKSSTGKITAEWIPVPDTDVSEALMQDIGKLFMSKTNKAKRLFYRCILLEKPVVSIVKVWEAPDIPGPGCKVIVREHVQDDSLTRGLRKPETLRSIPPNLLFRDCDRLFFNSESYGGLPAMAIMVHLKSDPVASKVAGGVFSAVSLGVGILLKVLGAN